MMNMTAVDLSAMSLTALDATEMAAIDGGGGWLTWVATGALALVTSLGKCLGENVDAIIDGARDGWQAAHG